NRDPVAVDGLVRPGAEGVSRRPHRPDPARGARGTGERGDRLAGAGAEPARRRRAAADPLAHDAGLRRAAAVDARLVLAAPGDGAAGGRAGGRAGAPPPPARAGPRPGRRGSDFAGSEAGARGARFGRAGQGAEGRMRRVALAALCAASAAQAGVSVPPEARGNALFDQANAAYLSGETSRAVAGYEA